MEFSLRTNRLSLRPLQNEDAQMIWPYVSDPAISKDMSWLPHSNIDETQAFIDNTLVNMKLGKCITWCIFMNGSFCGIFSLIGILRQHRSLVYNRAELAYWVGPEFQGKGIMTEAGTRIIDFAFNELGLHKLVVGHHINNEHSRKLILRLGFKYLYMEEEVFMKNNEWITCQFYQLKANDYLKK
jgi:[ribosomal protein S5]-alanine N-acetyltransferase